MRGIKNLAAQIKQAKLYGKDLITTQYWTKSELNIALQLATIMKRSRFDKHWQKILAYKTFLMFFYNTSIRTRLSFETAATELGGHAQFLTPAMARLKSATEAGETIEDVAKTISRYAAGMGLRIMEEELPYYGSGNEMLLEYIKHSNIPVINMANDKFHPCQGLADIMGWAEWLGDGGVGKPNFEQLKGKNLLLTWAKSKMTRTRSSVHEAILIASRYGMNVTIARPEGYDLDPEVYKWTKDNCDLNGSNFSIIDDPDSGYANAHVVYSRNWMSIDAYKDGGLQKQKEVEKALKHEDWITTANRMSYTDNGIYSHCMPIDRGREVTDEVASGNRSAIYDVAENRLHVQKAIMALTMGDLSRIHL